MKTLLKILLGVILLFALVVFLAMIFLPKDVHVERSATINASDSIVFAQVNNLENWKEWSVWLKKDPNTKLSYSSNRSGTGAWYTWESEDKAVGTGKLTIKESDPYKRIVSEIDFGAQGISQGSWTFKPNDKGGTDVTWALDSELSGFSKIFGLFMDGMVGGDFEKGLSNMKELVE